MDFKHQCSPANAIAATPCVHVQKPCRRSCTPVLGLSQRHQSMFAHSREGDFELIVLSILRSGDLVEIHAKSETDRERTELQMMSCPHAKVLNFPFSPPREKITRLDTAGVGGLFSSLQIETLPSIGDQLAFRGRIVVRGDSFFFSPVPGSHILTAPSQHRVNEKTTRRHRASRRCPYWYGGARAPRPISP